MRSVKDSSRPISMDRATTIFVMAGMADQLQVAPNCPSAGPELLMVAMERPRAEGISAPLAAIRAVHKKMDIGIYGSRIVDVFEPGTKPGKICGGKVIDASGMTVVPGLVDGHAHVLPGLRFSYPVDELWKRGITAVIDMGSQTSASFNRHRYLVDEAPCVVNACLGLSSMSETQGEISRYTVL